MRFVLCCVVPYLIKPIHFLHRTYSGGLKHYYMRSCPMVTSSEISMRRVRGIIITFMKDLLTTVI